MNDFSDNEKQIISFYLCIYLPAFIINREFSKMLECLAINEVEFFKNYLLPLYITSITLLAFAIPVVSSTISRLSENSVVEVNVSSHFLKFTGIYQLLVWVLICLFFCIITLVNISLEGIIDYVYLNALGAGSIIFLFYNAVVFSYKSLLVIQNPLSVILKINSKENPQTLKDLFIFIFAKYKKLLSEDISPERYSQIIERDYDQYISKILSDNTMSKTNLGPSWENDTPLHSCIDIYTDIAEQVISKRWDPSYIRKIFYVLTNAYKTLPNIGKQSVAIRCYHLLRFLMENKNRTPSNYERYLAILITSLEGMVRSIWPKDDHESDKLFDLYESIIRLIYMQMNYCQKREMKTEFNILYDHLYAVRKHIENSVFTANVDWRDKEKLINGRFGCSYGSLNCTNESIPCSLLNQAGSQLLDMCDDFMFSYYSYLKGAEKDDYAAHIKNFKLDDKSQHVEQKRKIFKSNKLILSSLFRLRDVIPISYQESRGSSIFFDWQYNDDPNESLIRRGGRVGSVGRINAGYSGEVIEENGIYNLDSIVKGVLGFNISENQQKLETFKGVANELTKGLDEDNKLKNALDSIIVEFDQEFQGNLQDAEPDLTKLSKWIECAHEGVKNNLPSFIFDNCHVKSSLSEAHSISRKIAFPKEMLLSEDDPLYSPVAGMKDYFKSEGSYLVSQSLYNYVSHKKEELWKEVYYKTAEDLWNGLKKEFDELKKQNLTPIILFSNWSKADWIYDWFDKYGMSRDARPSDMEWEDKSNLIKDGLGDFHYWCTVNKVNVFRVTQGLLDDSEIVVTAQELFKSYEWNFLSNESESYSESIDEAGKGVIELKLAVDVRLNSDCNGKRFVYSSD